MNDPHVIIFRTGAMAQCEKVIIGPFNSYDDAYDALCELPAPGEGGEKWITELTPPTFPAILRDLLPTDLAIADATTVPAR